MKCAIKAIKDEIRHKASPVKNTKNPLFQKVIINETEHIVSKEEIVIKINENHEEIWTDSHFDRVKIQRMININEILMMNMQE